ncbi:MAG: preprotein translocase subunit SecA [Ruminococcaceae bacterium]|nr:preprotein translocase subunit SecA [Oscillospiraceae bacterium]
MSLLDKLIGTYSERQLKKLNKTVDAIEALADRYAALSDAELAATTDALKARLAAGETLDDILPDAFAAVREADWRVLGKRPFRVQLIGGILLHQGRIAEMKTGEGKTLVATMPAYLNALEGKGVHIVTVNDYLARRDSEEMGRVYGFMGLTTGLVVHGQFPPEKQAAYAADITYGTNNEFGFDYLRDNMVIYRDRMVQRGHRFAIVDEVDSILIDEARTPLIISGEGDKSTDLYDRADTFVRKLRKFVIKELDDKQEQDSYDGDYIVDEKAKTATLTPSGVQKAEAFFGVENLADGENTLISHHINQALKAHGTMKLDVDYVVKDDSVIIVDAFTGRLMPGRRYSDGLHQAIEAKEKVKIEKENKTLATITFQNYFRLYHKLSGMTGTALTEETEFREIYSLDVVEVPTNKPMIRHDHPDAVYRTVKGKYQAIVEQVKACHAKGQPVLVGTVSIDKSELLSRMLKLNGIPHTVLNAKYHEKEAEIVAQAGKLGAVTISTNMAGRGTDIMLGGNAEFMAKDAMRRQGVEEELIAQATGSAVTEDEAVLAARATFAELYAKFKEEIAPEADQVRAAGGLFILGTERHESRRIDNQLRGRSGRQGDPGESRFFLSLEDDLMRLFGSERISGMVERLGLPEDMPIDAKILSGSIESAQKRIEDQNFKRRKYVLTYDDVMNQQRSIIYKQRQSVLDGDNITDSIQAMINQTIAEAVNEACAAEDHTTWELEALRDRYVGLLCNKDEFNYSPEELQKLKAEDITELLQTRAITLYHDKEKLFGEETFREIERAVLLRNVDTKWMDHIDEMDDLKGSIGLQAYAQRDPVNEYRLIGADMFDAMVAEIRENTVRTLLSIFPRVQPVTRVEVAKPLVEGFAGGRMPGQPQRPVAPRAGAPIGAPQKAAPKVGRNDPCPCGSGKKYKKCCGLGAEDDSAPKA